MPDDRKPPAPLTLRDAREALAKAEAAGARSMTLELPGDLYAGLVGSTFREPPALQHAEVYLGIYTEPPEPDDEPVATPIGPLPDMAAALHWLNGFAIGVESAGRIAEWRADED